ncbi:MAG: hypothetical protein PHH08_04125 [Candidatus ainarchaeum sp.]|nr:hypothetical protein [Candidatus ainarchaeum sp.]
MKTGMLFAGIVLAAVFFSGCVDPIENPINAAQCPEILQECGAGCIPQNSICCDDGAYNGYCLQPANGCDNGENCRGCPLGQVFCGMFCIPEGQECCLGGICSGQGTEPPVTPTEPDITLVSEPKIVCTFQRTESLWSPDMPWDGSYVCRGTVKFDFHGLKFSTNKTFKLYVENGKQMMTGDVFNEYRAPANTPIGEVTFTYAAIGGDYFQKNKPACPAEELSGLRLVEKIPDIEEPFPTQEFDVAIPASCE